MAKDRTDKATHDYIESTQTMIMNGHGRTIKEGPYVPFVRNPYNYDLAKASDDSGLACKDESLTQQHMAEDCDINTIVKRFNLTGELPTNVRMPTSGDFTNVPTFTQALDAIIAARHSFEAMPANVRSRFHNDPAEFVAFCDDPDNLEEARKLGLVPPAEIKAPPTPQGEQNPPKEAGKETPKKGVT